MEIKKCPFCGGEATFNRGKSWYSGLCWISCENEDCKIKPETTQYYYKKEAIEAWNRRVDDGKKD